jgi:hypothetical protein
MATFPAKQLGSKEKYRKPENVPRENQKRRCSWRGMPVVVKSGKLAKQNKAERRRDRRVAMGK